MKQTPLISAFGLGALAVLAFGTTLEAHAQSLIGVNFTTATSGTPDPQNWNRYSQGDGVLSNLQDENGNATGVAMNITGNVGGNPTTLLYLSTSTLAGDATPQYDYDLSGMTGYGFRASGEFTMEIRGLIPNFDYEYWFVAYRGGATIDNIVQVSNGDTLNDFSFNQFITSTDNNGRFLVNTVNANNTMHWNDLFFTTTSSSAGTITYNFAGDTQTTVIGAFAIRAVPEPATMAGLGAGLLFLLRRRKATKA